jgi:hypothetical protein
VGVWTIVIRRWLCVVVDGGAVVMSGGGGGVDQPSGGPAPLGDIWTDHHQSPLLMRAPSRLQAAGGLGELPHPTELRRFNCHDQSHHPAGLWGKGDVAVVPRRSLRKRSESLPVRTVFEIHQSRRIRVIRHD